MGRPFCKYARAFAIASGVSFAIVAVVLLFMPVACINQSACDQIQPGMTVSDAEAIIGARPDWYDGVFQIRTGAPGYKGYCPNWIGSDGEIMLVLNEQRLVSAARFYPGVVTGRSLSKLAWERVTRNAFGTGRTDLVIEIAESIFAGLFFSGAVVLTALVAWSDGWVTSAFGVCVVGAIVSFSVLFFAFGLPNSHSLLGASSAALVAFAVGLALTGRRKRPKRNAE